MCTTSNANEKAAAIRRILLFDDTPAWMQVDPHIRRGYRDELKSIWNCILSLFYVHNEFVNVWSHLLPAIVHLVLLVKEAQLVQAAEKGTSTTDTAMIHLYIVSAILCLLSSVRGPLRASDHQKRQLS
jgi:adiponectin receptor